MFADYINIHAKQDAEKLGGSYGIKEGVEILPASRGSHVDAKLLASAQDPDTGENYSFG
jgi:hypothetical protein